MEKLNKNRTLVILSVIIFLSFISYTIYLNNEIRDLKNSTVSLNNKINDLDNKYTIEEKNGQLDVKFSYSVEKILPSVVLIISETPLSQLPFTGGEYVSNNNKIYSKGTGFIVSQNGFIITADHVVNQASGDINVILEDGRQFRATIIDNNTDADVALIKIEGASFPYAEFGSPEEIRLGDKIGFIGFPLTYNFPITNEGIISSIITSPYPGKQKPVMIFTLNSFVNHGNSGGPVFTANGGKVIGIINQRANDVNENLFIKLPPGYSSGVFLSGIDPIVLSVETYNQNLRTIGDVTQVGIGFSSSAQYAKELLAKHTPR